ncbi:MATE family efflux transporter, partial [Klebsiella pneumoniae]|uniref:MATE family efflux transporter n=1 Tax=Klebsiella pneumoniae TaxID=573 RepID=UPI001C627A2E
IVFTILAHWKPGLLLDGFSNDRETMAVAAQFLYFVSMNLDAQGLVFTCNSMFQGLGNTRPVLVSSTVRLVTYAVPVIWLSTQPGFRIEHV